MAQTFLVHSSKEIKLNPVYLYNSHLKALNSLRFKTLQTYLGQRLKIDYGIKECTGELRKILKPKRKKL